MRHETTHYHMTCGQVKLHLQEFGSTLYSTHKALYAIIYFTNSYPMFGGFIPLSKKIQQVLLVAIMFTMVADPVILFSIAHAQLEVEESLDLGHLVQEENLVEQDVIVEDLFAADPVFIEDNTLDIQNKSLDQETPENIEVFDTVEQQNSDLHEHSEEDMQELFTVDEFQGGETNIQDVAQDFRHHRQEEEKVELGDLNIQPNTEKIRAGALVKRGDQSLNGRSVKLAEVEVDDKELGEEISYDEALMLLTSITTSKDELYSYAMNKEQFQVFETEEQVLVEDIDFVVERVVEEPVEVIGGFIQDILHKEKVVSSDEELLETFLSDLSEGATKCDRSSVSC